MTTLHLRKSISRSSPRLGFLLIRLVTLKFMKLPSLFRNISSAWIFCFLFATLPAFADPPCAISSNFNGTPIAGGNYIWFNSVFSLPGFDTSHLTSPLTINFTGVTITFGSTTINAPNVSITYDPSNPPPTTTFTPGSPGMWTTVLPITHLSGNNFLDAVEFLVPSGGLPGGIHPLTWSGTFTSSMPGLQVQWKWGAAVYDTTFSTNYNALGVKPVDDNKASTYKNSDHAGTPENFKTHVRGGATGGGGSNYTGSYSGTGSCGTTGVPPAIASCLPTSSLGVLVQGSIVTAYVPLGSWGFGNTGVQVVPIEPPGPFTNIMTASIVNSCSSNSSTGETVCVANNTDVYLITGTTLNTTLTSGANAFTGFSGGSCMNCGVTINAVTNTAVIAMGFTPSPSTSALQFLNLGTNIFAAPFPAVHEVSEDILWDPSRNLILSPSEFSGVYDLFNTSSATPVEFGNSVGGILDSACEDCLTGIALSTNEGTNTLFLADLTQATFVAGTWTSGAGQGFQTFPEFSGFSAGTSGIAVAPGSHLGIVSGEFGGNQFGVIQLPSTAGGTPPLVVDYAAATLPNDPNGFPRSMGCDPHTLTAYVSPTTGKAIGLMTDYAPTFCGTPAFIAVIDLQGLLNAPRISGTHTVSVIPAGVVTYVQVQ
jgi:hypothetical protein